MVNSFATRFQDSLQCQISWPDIVSDSEEIILKDSTKVELRITNVSSMPIQAPRYNLVITAYDSGDDDINPQIAFGDEPYQTQFKLTKVLIENFEERFHLIQPEEEFSIPLSLADLCHQCGNCKRTGKYRLRILFRNVWWSEALDPMWVGEKWTNELHFRVTE